MGFGFIAFALAISSFANIPHELSHLDPEMTGAEYRTLFEKNKIKVMTTDVLDEVMFIGKRNLDLLTAINNARPENLKLELWTPENTMAYPIDAPSISNRSIVRKNFDKIVSELPAPLKKTLWASGSLPSTIALDDETYLAHARKLDRAYQSASRWILQEPYLFAYQAAAKNDVRGFYFLSHDSQLEQKLNNFDSQNEETKKHIRVSLFQMCRNNIGRANACNRKVNKAIEDKKCLEFYNEQKAESQRVYNSFFKLGGYRKDVTWNSSNPNVATVPFQMPEPEIKQWLIDNVEDEWKWGDWKLKLDFKTSGAGPHVVFVAGATPNVNGLGGNKITMDANRPIEHYSTRWTIRHEFGHVLGFPDCYIEFYDSEEEVMVNYQLDITDLMCSRRGKLKEIHYKEFKRNYFKP